MKSRIHRRLQQRGRGNGSFYSKSAKNYQASMRDYEAFRSAVREYPRDKIIESINMILPSEAEWNALSAEDKKSVIDALIEYEPNNPVYKELQRATTAGVQPFFWRDDRYVAFLKGIRDYVVKPLSNIPGPIGKIASAINKGISVAEFFSGGFDVKGQQDRMLYLIDKDTSTANFLSRKKYK